MRVNINIVSYRPFEGDQPDDCFVLRDQEHDWQQRIPLREMAPLEDGGKAAHFSGWPAETTKVDLLRTCHGDDDTGEETLILSQVDIIELLNES
ncbi:hypothetical protein [Vibrio sp. WXL210]|uniref:hypothetical protein n=1 Tax=Vibrio sp. WXL210 TaxID=3450709 RepID=UPI003EC6400B